MANRYTKYGTRLLAGGLLLLMAASLQPMAAQPRVTPSFEVDAVAVRASDSATETRLDVYTKIPYAKLRFTNQPDGFTARYEVTLEAYAVDRKGRRQTLVASRLWDRTFAVTSYAGTQSTELVDRTTQSMNLTPGRYELQIQLEDQVADEVFVREMPLEVRNLGGDVAISDLILIDRFDEETKTISPSVSGRVGTDAFGLQIFYELYADAPQAVRVTRDVLQVQRGGGLTNVRSVLGLGSDTPDAVSYTSEVTDVQSGRNQAVVRIPTERFKGGFKAGDYVVRIRVENEEGDLLSQTEKRFTAEWTGLAEHIQNIDEAIAQLQYIAKGKDLRHIQSASTKSERIARFQAFWEKRDPTPGTERNEKMEEYYYRIANANRSYGSRADGWKTDRGQVAVLFGEPDTVERHPYNFDAKPYEVWFYYQIGRQFIFVDKSGFGEYDLLVPIWDERTRIR